MGGFSFSMRVCGRHNIGLHASTPRVESLYAITRMLVKSTAIFLEKQSVVKGLSGTLEQGRPARPGDDATTANGA